MLEDVEDGLFDELLGIFELESTICAVLVCLLRGMDSVVDGVHNGFNYLQHFTDAVQSSLRGLLLLYHFLLLLFFTLLTSIHIDMFLLLPKLLIDKFFQILMYLLNHDYSFEYGSSLLLHEIGDELKLALDCAEITTLEFEGYDPVGDYFVEGCFFSDLVVECLVVPQAIAEHFEQGHRA